MLSVSSNSGGGGSDTNSCDNKISKDLQKDENTTFNKLELFRGIFLIFFGRFLFRLIDELESGTKSRFGRY